MFIDLNIHMFLNQFVFDSYHLGFSSSSESDPSESSLSESFYKSIETKDYQKSFGFRSNYKSYLWNWMSF